MRASRVHITLKSEDQSGKYSNELSTLQYHAIGWTLTCSMLILTVQEKCTKNGMERALPSRLLMSHLFHVQLLSSSLSDCPRCAPPLLFTALSETGTKRNRKEPFTIPEGLEATGPYCSPVFIPSNPVQRPPPPSLRPCWDDSVVSCDQPVFPLLHARRFGIAEEVSTPTPPRLSLNLFLCFSRRC